MGLHLLPVVVYFNSSVSKSSRFFTTLTDSRHSKSLVLMSLMCMWSGVTVQFKLLLYPYTQLWSLTGSLEAVHNLCAALGVDCSLRKPPSMQARDIKTGHCPQHVLCTALLAKEWHIICGHIYHLFHYTSIIQTVKEVMSVKFPKWTSLIMVFWQPHNTTFSHCSEQLSKQQTWLSV